MKPIRLPPHAVDQLRDRQLRTETVELTIREPQGTSTLPFRRKALVRRYFDEELGQPMLMRVIVEENESEIVVVTVYRTSKIEKYLQQESS